MKKKLLLTFVMAGAVMSAEAQTPAHTSVPAPSAPASTAVSQSETQLLSSIQAALLQLNATSMEQLQALLQASRATPDSNRFCYLDGKAFSEGAEYAGRLCARSGIRVSSPTAPNGWDDPLQWQPKRAKAGGNA